MMLRKDQYRQQVKTDIKTTATATKIARKERLLIIIKVEANRHNRQDRQTVEEQMDRMTHSGDQLRPKGKTELQTTATDTKIAMN